MKRYILLIFISVLALAVAPVYAHNSDEKLKQNLQAKLGEWHKSGKFAGATLGVCQADGKCFALAVGFSDLNAKTPMKPSDLMLAGSVGKTFAAAVALQLVSEKKNRSRRQDRKISRKRSLVFTPAECEGNHGSPTDESHERFNSL